MSYNANQGGMLMSQTVNAQDSTNHRNNSPFKAIYDSMISSSDASDTASAISKRPDNEQAFAGCVAIAKLRGFYDNDKTFDAVCKAKNTAEKMHIQLRDTLRYEKNPFAQPCIRLSLILTGLLAILIAGLYFVSDLPNLVQMLYMALWMFFFGLGVRSLGVFINTFRYQRIRKIAPPEYQIRKDPIIPSYEQCLSLFRQVNGYTLACVPLIKKLRRVNWLTFGFTFVVNIGGLAIQSIAESDMTTGSILFACMMIFIIAQLLILFLRWKKLHDFLKDLPVPYASVPHLHRAYSGLVIGSIIAAVLFLFMSVLYVGSTIT